MGFQKGFTSYRFTVALFVAASLVLGACGKKPAAKKTEGKTFTPNPFGQTTVTDGDGNDTPSTPGIGVGSDQPANGVPYTGSGENPNQPPLQHNGGAGTLPFFYQGLLAGGLDPAFFQNLPLYAYLFCGPYIYANRTHLVSEISFLYHLWNRVIGTFPSPAELLQFIEELPANQTFSNNIGLRRTYAGKFVYGNEHLDAVTFKIITTLFNRVPTASENADLIQRMKTGTTMETIIAEKLTSDEFKNWLFEGATVELTKAERFVIIAYRVALSRDPSYEEKRYWATSPTSFYRRADMGQISGIPANDFDAALRGIAMAMFRSDEYLAKAVQVAWNTYVGRGNPSQGRYEGLVAWMKANPNRYVLELIQEVVASDEFFADAQSVHATQLNIFASSNYCDDESVQQIVRALFGQ